MLADASSSAISTFDMVSRAATTRPEPRRSLRTWHRVNQ